MSAFGRIRSCPRVYGTTQKLQNSLHPSMIVTYALTGSPRRVTPSGNVTSSYGFEVDRAGARVDAAACSTSIGSRRIACVPTMTSATPGDALAACASPSCCATQPATATIGSWPLLGRQLAQLAEARVELLLGALADAAGVDDDDVGVGRVVGRLEAGLLEQPRHPLGVVDVHLAAERLDQIFTRHRSTFGFRLRLSLSPFAFRLRAFALARLSRTPAASVKHLTGRRAEAPSVIASPPSIRASSSTRPSRRAASTVVSRAAAARPASRSGSACRRTPRSAAGA